MKTALITGITGQDGSYLAELLVGRGVAVHGVVRRSSRGNGALENIAAVRDRVTLHHGDLADGTSLCRIVKEVAPDWVFNLAAQADVGDSFLMPEYTIDVNGVGVIRLLEACRRFAPEARIYQASTSELFGNEPAPQSEGSRMTPQSPYAVGKLAGYHAVRHYREAYGMFAVNGITFNHASPRRTDDYLDRKVTKAVARIKLGKQKVLCLGNLNTYRDWSYAKEVVEAFVHMLEMEKPCDLVLGSGVAISGYRFVEEAFKVVGLEMKNHVIIDPALFRPSDVSMLRADGTKALEAISWRPLTPVEALIEIMVKADLERESK